MHEQKGQFLHFLLKITEKEGEKTPTCSLATIGDATTRVGGTNSADRPTDAKVVDLFSIDFGGGDGDSDVGEAVAPMLRGACGCVFARRPPPPPPGLVAAAVSAAADISGSAADFDRANSADLLTFA